MKYTIKLGSCIDGTVPLGWQNENKVKEVYFDASKWVAEYGAGILTLAIQRNGDAQPYPKALTDDTWTIEAVDVEKKGIGEFQVTFTVGEQVKESAVYKFFVERSLDSTGEMPDPYISYFEQIVEVGAQAEADADRAEEAADSIKNLTAEAETLPAGSSASASYDSETGVMTFGIPQGEQGERGADGVTPDIDIGTVETLETGVPAYANITGTVENPSLNLGLPKGNTGDTGATGAPAGFGAVTATIDGTTGTPSVDVTASGADTAKNFAFAFHNLKGEQGEQGEQGDPGVVQDVKVNGTSVVAQDGVAYIKVPELVKTVQGNPIVIDDAFGGVKNLTVELLPIQEGSGTPSPQNVRPITGHDSVTVGVTGKNLWGGLTMAQDIVDITPNAVLDTTAKTVTYSAGNISGKTVHTDFKANTQYTFILTSGSTNAKPNLCIYYTDGTSSAIADFSNNKSVTVSKNGESILRLGGIWQSGDTVLKYEECGLFEGVLTASDFAPYHGQSKTVTLPHTVYGAGVGVTSGSGKEKYVIVDLGELNYAPYTTSGVDYFYTEALQTLAKRPATASDKANIMCTIYPNGIASDITTTEKYVWLYTNGNLCIKDPTYTTAAELKTALSGVYLCYELATPTDLTTTPTDLTLYSGDNVISSDGDMELSYVQDMATVIRKIEAQL